MVFWASTVKDDPWQVTGTGSNVLSVVPPPLVVSNAVKCTYTMTSNWSLEMAAEVLGKACKAPVLSG